MPLRVAAEAVYVEEAEEVEAAVDAVPLLLVVVVGKVGGQEEKEQIASAAALDTAAHALAMHMAAAAAADCAAASERSTADVTSMHVDAAVLYNSIAHDWDPCSLRQGLQQDSVEPLRLLFDCQVPLPNSLESWKHHWRHILLDPTNESSLLSPKLWPETYDFPRLR